MAVECPYCGKVIQNRGALAKHIQWRHPEYWEEGNTNQIQEKKEEIMSDKVIDFLKADLDHTKSELKRLDEKLSKMSRVVERPDGSYYCVGDTCIKISELQKELLDVRSKVEKMDKRFNELENTTLGDLLLKDKKSQQVIQNLASKIAQSIAKAQAELAVAKLRGEIEEALHKQEEGAKKSQDQPKRSRLYELFIAPREEKRKGVSHG